MNLTQLFTRDEHIVGLELSSSALRVVFLKKSPRSQTVSVVIAKEVILTPGVIVDGRVGNKAELVKALKSLSASGKRSSRYVVASIPSHEVYVRPFRFPLSVSGERLDEAMQLSNSSQLPVSPKDQYIDWQTRPYGDSNDVLLNAAPKSVVEPFIDALQMAGLKPVALEFHHASLARAITIPTESSVLVTDESDRSTVVSFIKNGMVRFLRVLPPEFILKKDRPKEIERIASYLEKEEGQRPLVTAREKLSLTTDITLSDAIKTNESVWLVVIGAAMRAMIPRPDDSLNSLLPIGSEEAYKIQKATSFAQFISSTTIAVSLCISGVFIAAWLFLVSFEQTTVSHIQVLSSVPPPADAATVEQQA
ncbi:MAG: pilus assembly protein PilM, partial [Patescibacteria group bacterium]